MGEGKKIKTLRGYEGNSFFPFPAFDVMVGAGIVKLASCLFIGDSGYTPGANEIAITSSAASTFLELLVLSNGLLFRDNRSYSKKSDSH